MLKSLADIKPELLTEVTALAELFFTPQEISLQLEIDSDFMKGEMIDENSPVYQAFQRGRLQSEVELRKSILKLAKSGSSPAQTMALDILNKSKIKMLDR